MLTVTSRWAPTITGNHTPAYRFEVWRTGTQLIPKLSVAGGAVTKDGSAWPRITASIDVADTSPDTAQLLTPFGSRVRIYRGLTYSDNTQELPLIADLDIVSARFARPDGTLTLELADPSAAVSADLVISPVSYGGQIGVTPPLTVGEAIQAILAGATYYGTHTLDTTGASVAVGSSVGRDYVLDGDRWDAIEQLADSIGHEVFFTPDRRPILRVEPKLKTTPDALLYALEGGTVTGTVSALARQPNACVVYGAPDDTTGKQIRGIVWDSVSTSPTYVGGPYGRVVLIEQRPVAFTTAAQARDVAASMLDRAQRGVRTVELEAVPNPALEPGDTIEVKFMNGVKEKHQIRSVEIPLGAADHMTLTCSSTSYVTAGWP